MTLSFYRKLLEYIFEINIFTEGLIKFYIIFIQIPTICTENFEAGEKRITFANHFLKE
jgi:hypothetical protein